jgi:hypothetical protein
MGSAVSFMTEAACGPLLGCLVDVCLRVTGLESAITPKTGNHKPQARSSQRPDFFLMITGSSWSEQFDQQMTAEHRVLVLCLSCRGAVLSVLEAFLKALGVCTG